MKTGVSTSPCGVISRPERAFSEVCSTWNFRDTDGIVSNALSALSRQLTERDRWSRSNLQDFGGDRFGVDHQSAHAYRQLESFRSGAAGVEVENAVLDFLVGNVAMTKNESCESSGFGLQVKLLNVVQDID